MDHDKQCVLVIIGADAMGNKDIVGMVDGYRESAQSWKQLLLDLKRRSLDDRPRVGRRRRRLGLLEGATRGLRRDQGAALLGPQDRQRLNQMPKSLQAKAKGLLHDIWMAETRADAEAAFDFFIAAAKYLQGRRAPGQGP